MCLVVQVPRNQTLFRTQSVSPRWQHVLFKESSAEPNKKCRLMSSLGDELGAGKKQENKLKWQAIGNYPWICQNLSGLAPNKKRTIFIFGYEYTQNWRWQAPAYGNSPLRRRKCQEFGLGSINAGSDSSAACPEIWLFMKCLSRGARCSGSPNGVASVYKNSKTPDEL